jgi:hypothetical protein
VLLAFGAKAVGSIDFLKGFLPALVPQYGGQVCFVFGLSKMKATLAREKLVNEHQHWITPGA